MPQDGFLMSTCAAHSQKEKSTLSSQPRWTGYERLLCPYLHGVPVCCHMDRPCNESHRSQQHRARVPSLPSRHHSWLLVKSPKRRRRHFSLGFEVISSNEGHNGAKNISVGEAASKHHRHYVMISSHCHNQAADKQLGNSA